MLCVFSDSVMMRRLKCPAACRDRDPQVFSIQFLGPILHTSAFKSSCVEGMREVERL